MKQYLSMKAKGKNVDDLPNPLGDVLRDYCHVNWYEVAELAEDVREGKQAFDSDALKAQFEKLISEGEIPYLAINRLTANEFESGSEARIWLSAIYAKVFGG